MTSDYTYPVGSSMWFEGKKELNSTFPTPIQNPTCADLCQLHLNAIHAFPGKEIFAVREDMPYAYNGVRIHPPSAPLGSLLFCASPLGLITPE